MTLLVRLARPEDIRAACAVRVTSWRESYPGMVPQNLIDNLNLEGDVARWEANPLPENAYRFVAELEGEIVGFGICSPLRKGGGSKDGEVRAVYLVNAAKGKGVGRALMQNMAQKLADDGMATMTVSVLTANKPARQFYERLGGIYQGEGSIEIGGVKLDEVVYRWDDIRTLLPQTPQKQNKPKGP